MDCASGCSDKLVKILLKQSKIAMIHVLAEDIVDNKDQWNTKLKEYIEIGVTSINLCVRDWKDSNSNVITKTTDTSIQVVKVLIESLKLQNAKIDFKIHLIPHLENVKNPQKVKGALNTIAKEIF